MIKKLFFLMFISGLLSCAAPSPYQLEYSNQGGYSEIKLSPTSYQISFKGNGDTNSERTNDLALLRAAQITLQQGFKYLAIISKNSYVTGKNVRIWRTKTTPIIHTMYKGNNAEMCRIDINGTVKYVDMSGLPNQEMMKEHSQYAGDSYLELVYEDYLDDYIIEEPRTIILIELYDSIKVDFENIQNATEIVEKITKKYQIKLNT